MTHFMDLPSEVRIQIYKLVFAGTAVRYSLPWVQSLQIYNE